MTLPHTGCLDCNSGPDWLLWPLLCSSRGGESWSFGRGFYQVLSSQIIENKWKAKIYLTFIFYSYMDLLVLSGAFLMTIDR